MITAIVSDIIWVHYTDAIVPYCLVVVSVSGVVHGYGGVSGQWISE